MYHVIKYHNFGAVDLHLKYKRKLSMVRLTPDVHNEMLQIYITMLSNYKRD